MKTDFSIDLKTCSTYSKIRIRSHSVNSPNSLLSILANTDNYRGFEKQDIISRQRPDPLSKHKHCSFRMDHFIEHLNEQHIEELISRKVIWREFV